MPVKTKASGKEKKVTRYTYENVTEPRTPETGHTALLPADEQVVTLPMDNGWSKAIDVGKLSEKDDQPVLVDMDPTGVSRYQRKTLKRSLEIDWLPWIQDRTEV